MDLAVIISGNCFFIFLIHSLVTILLNSLMIFFNVHWVRHSLIKSYMLRDEVIPVYVFLKTKLLVFGWVVSEL